jgi:hypothetical protein
MRRRSSSTTVQKSRTWKSGERAVRSSTSAISFAIASIFLPTIEERTVSIFVVARASTVLDRERARGSRTHFYVL